MKQTDCRNEHRDSETCCPTFADLTGTVIAFRRPAWTNVKHAAQWGSSLERYAFPLLGWKQVCEVRAADVLAVLQPIWHEKRETAARVQQRIKVIFDHAILHGWRRDNPALPVAQALPRLRRTKAHYPAMPYADLPTFFASLELSSITPMTRLALSFLILTAARSGEVRLMEWAEVDFESATWIVPAFRMKARVEHRVPLSAPALAVLQEALGDRKGCGLVFPAPGCRPLSNMAFTMVLRRAALDAVPHGFRSSFKDWTLEQTGFPWAVVERALAHTVGNATEAAYARSDLFARRRDLMEAWAAYCTSGGIPVTQVTPIKVDTTEVALPRE